MGIFILFLVEILALFFLSRRLQRVLGRALYRALKSRKKVAYALAILFLPGTFFHEVSHFLSALFLLVPVGQMELMAEVSEDGRTRLGSVPVGETDFVRRTLVGIAPLVFGTAAILGIFFYTTSKGLLGVSWVTLLVAYLVFEIANTMFLSKQDLKGIWVFIIASLLFALAFFLFTNWVGVDVTITFAEKTREVLTRAALFLLIPIVFDLVVIFGLSLADHGIVKR